MDIMGNQTYNQLMAEKKKIMLRAGVNDHNRRLDRILRRALPDYSLSLIHRLLRQKEISVNNEIISSPGYRILQGMVIEIKAGSFVNQDSLPVNKPVPQNKIIPGNLPEIIWQGNGLVFFNKPSGIATHGPDSLDELVKDSLAEKMPPSLSFKPGPLHRLDKPTSGIIAFSETLGGAQLFTRLMQDQKIIKTYIAIVEGRISSGQIWEDKLFREKKTKKTLTNSSAEKQKNAVTGIKPIISNEQYTLIEAQIHTGRTHQIRAQAAAHGHPLAGDAKYGGKKISGAPGARGNFFLHAWKMKIEYNCSVIPEELTAPIPSRFINQMQCLFGQELASKINTAI